MFIRRAAMMDLLQLFRPEYVISAISNSWLMVTISLHFEPTMRQTPYLTQSAYGWVLLLTGLIPAGLSVYGLCINDILDMRHDRAFRPNRPLLRGRVTIPTVVAVATCSLLVAVGAATFLGKSSTFLCLLTAGAILFFNLCGKFFPATGIISMGLIRAMIMFIPVPMLGYAWPVCLAMGHVMVCTAVAYGLEGKRPRLRGTELAQVVAGALFWTTLLIVFMIWRHTLRLADWPRLWIGPFFAMLVFVVVATGFLWRRLGQLRTRRQTIHLFLRFSTLWLIVYDMSWMIAANRLGDGLRHFGLFLVALIMVGGLILHARGLTRPPTYRLTPLR